MKLLHILLACLLVTLAIPTVTAQVGVQLQDPTPYIPGELEVGDRDGDGHEEVSYQYTTPPCGCYCPVVGSYYQVQAAGQEVSGWGATGICQHGVSADVDPGNINAWGTYGANVDPFFWPAGLGPVLDDLGGAVALSLPPLP